MAVTTKINFWADTLARASLEELQLIRRSLLVRKGASTDLVLMVQAEIERRQSFTRLPGGHHPPCDAIRSASATSATAPRTRVP